MSPNYFTNSYSRNAGPVVRIAPNEVAISDRMSIKPIYGIKSGYTKVDSTYDAKMASLY